MTKYLIAIDPGDDEHCFGVLVPDLPGCFSVGDSFDEALVQVRDAIETWVDMTLDGRSRLPAPREPKSLINDPTFRGWMWATVEVRLVEFHADRWRTELSMPKRWPAD